MITRFISQHVSPQTPLRLREYVLLIAALFSMVAFSIDSILPALPEIGSQLVPDDINKAQLLISAFVIGAGFGQLVFGPLSDSMGRRFSLSMGMLLYMLAAFAAFWAQTLEAILFWRFVQGLGAAGPRTCGMAMTRDLYEGRQMARVNSMAFGFFVFVPAVAPMIGQWIVQGFGWRQMFTAYILLAAAILTWFLLRQPETLPQERRRPLSLRPTLSAFKVVLQTRVTLIYMAIITLAFGQLMSFISSADICRRIGSWYKLPLLFRVGDGFFRLLWVLKCPACRTLGNASAGTGGVCDADGSGFTDAPCMVVFGPARRVCAVAVLRLGDNTFLLERAEFR